ncbi:MAG: hypothetical protein ACRDLN_02685 [Solirubrobacteraceae bacterium]
MPDGFGELMTRRRLGGAALILAGLVVAGLVLWSMLRDDEPARARATPVRLVSVPQFGLAFAHPRNWTQSVKGRVVRLRSPDGAAVLTFSSLPGREPKRVKSALERALRKQFDPAEIVRDGTGLLGRRRVDSFELSGIGPTGPVRALGLVEDTPHRTYAVTVLTPGRPSRKRLREALQILDSVRLTKPVSLKG